MTKTHYSYLKGFGAALVAEGIALLFLLPGFAMTGMRHSANAPKQDIVVIAEWMAFVAHLPTILLTWPFRNSTIPIIFLTPISQLIFFTILFAYVFRRMRFRSSQQI